MTFGHIMAKISKHLDTNLLMLTIRLQRAGKKNRPDFRIILAEKKAAASKKFNEILGTYNPRTKAFVLKNPERVQYWISQHVEMSPTIHNLFVTQKVITEKKVTAFSVPKKQAEPEKEVKAEAQAENAPASEETPAAPEEKSVEEVAA